MAAGMTDLRLDGNVLAGTLEAMFGTDMTSMNARCAGCGLLGPVAETIVYGQPTSYVARCPGCDSVLMTVVAAPDRTFLGFQGIRHFELPDSEPSAPR